MLLVVFTDVMSNIDMSQRYRKQAERYQQALEHK
ncbi:hypothetical protein Krac_3857 [Ktedonobacter racemifer DSM 44963]|uniref:Uncharacterized protein n=1 Tax=Ktedonobacter racemifer DSM 44963 TaxID=485913 RepID=D6U3G9_KTERA|nr:hypothetical protein Krac_3857 [Ktedonobacter racemifer DSM 44963]